MKLPVLGVSQPTLRRLPQYHHYLQHLLDQGRDVVSCTHIGAALRLDPTQVRKDLACTGIRGQAKVGYSIATLMRSIEDFLDWNNVTEAFLIGVGHLGAALLGYKGFARYGLKLIAGFDTDPAKHGRRINGIEVYPLSKMPNLVVRMKIHLAVLTVPRESAQDVTNDLVRAGITGIWNFSPAILEVPDSVIVQNENLASGLAVLSKKLAGLQGL